MPDSAGRPREVTSRLRPVVADSLSAADAGVGPIDLRKPADAKLTEKMLTKHVAAMADGRKVQ